MSIAPLPPWTVAMVDNHPVVLDGLKTVLGDPEKYTVVLSATSGAEFLAGMRKVRHVDLAIVDLSMPGMDGFAVLRSLKTASPGTRAVAFSFSEELAWVRRAMNAGARGYLLKGSHGSDVRTVLETVALKGEFHSTLVLASLIATEETEEGLDVSNIPVRELEYLRHLCDPRDLTYHQIADLMGVTRHAVDGYRRYFSKRFDLHSKGAVILFALEYNLVPPPAAN